MPHREFEYEYERLVHSNIDEVGWHVVAVAATKESDFDIGAFAYTLGLTKNFSHPEVCVIGLGHQVTAPMLDGIAERVKDGERFADWQGCDEILERYTCIFREVERHHYPELFGFARWFNGSDEFSMLQCVWPDKSGRYPWNCKPDSNLDDHQYVLSSLSDWPFPVAKNALVKTTRQVVDGELPVCHIAHLTEGTWQFSSGSSEIADEVRYATLSDIVDSDPTVLETANLNVGGKASRKNAKGAWLKS